MKVKNRAVFKEPTRSQYRDKLYCDVLSVVSKSNYLSEYDVCHVLNLVKHKVVEGVVYERKKM